METTLVAERRYPWMPENRTPSISRLAEVLRTKPEVAQRFAPHASETDVVELVTTLGVALPDEFIELFQLINGNVKPAWDEGKRELVGEEETLFPDSTLRLLSLEAIPRTKQSWDDLAHEYEMMDDDARLEKWHLAFWRTSWIPFVVSEAEVFALATEPCFGGPRNQVVWFDFKGHECWEVPHESFADWIDTLAEMLNADASRFDEAIGRRLNPKWRFIELVQGETSADRFARRGTLK